MHITIHTEAHIKKSFDTADLIVQKYLALHA